MFRFGTVGRALKIHVSSPTSAKDLPRWRRSVGDTCTTPSSTALSVVSLPVSLPVFLVFCQSLLDVLTSDVHTHVRLKDAVKGVDSSTYSVTATSPRIYHFVLKFERDLNRTTFYCWATLALNILAPDIYIYI